MDHPDFSEPLGHRAIVLDRLVHADRAVEHAPFAGVLRAAPRGRARSPRRRSGSSLDDVFELSYGQAVAAARRLIVLRALERAAGHQTRAAERLGISQPYLSRLIRQLRIRRGDSG